MTPTILAIRHTVEDAAVVEVALSRDHPAFAGHFPGRPVLPGVVQLDWALRAAAACFGYPFRPCRKFQVKFMRIITPEHGTATISLRMDRARQFLHFEFRVGDVPASSGRVSLDA